MKRGIRKKYADCMGKLIDGHGTERIADVLCQKLKYKNILEKGK